MAKANSKLSWEKRLARPRRRKNFSGEWVDCKRTTSVRVNITGLQVYKTPKNKIDVARCGMRIKQIEDALKRALPGNHPDNYPLLNSQYKFVCANGVWLISSLTPRILIGQIPDILRDTIWGVLGYYVHIEYTVCERAYLKPMKILEARTGEFDEFEYELLRE